MCDISDRRLAGNAPGREQEAGLSLAFTQDLNISGFYLLFIKQKKENQFWSKNEEKGNESLIPVFHLSSAETRGFSWGAGPSCGGAEALGRSPEDRCSTSCLRHFCLNEDLWCSEAELQVVVRQQR